MHFADGRISHRWNAAGMPGFSLKPYWTITWGKLPASRCKNADHSGDIDVKMSQRPRGNAGMKKARRNRRAFSMRLMKPS